MTYFRKWQVIEMKWFKNVLERGKFRKWHVLKITCISRNLDKIIRQLCVLKLFRTLYQLKH